ncbi:MAG: sigma-70 family RNA polymerase sigma factor [Acidimicrobiia bacterium]|nr:sigma-70 family RNA polymerase sigma factor [Acidimicrobiia bacterium]
MPDSRESVVIDDDVGSVDSLGDATVILDFGPFYQEHRQRVGAALAFTLGDHQLGYEAADEAMARAYQRWSAVQTYANPSGWVYRTGLNWARSWLRRHRRSRPKDRMLARSEHGDGPQSDTDLAAALAKLSDEHRSVVVLRFFCDWSVADTAAALDVAPGTVKSRLARALSALRAELESTDPGRERTEQ